MVGCGENVPRDLRDSRVWVTFADLVFQVLRVVVGEESLVVYKEDDLRDRYGSVAVVDCGGAVEDL